MTSIYYRSIDIDIDLCNVHVFKSKFLFSDELFRVNGTPCFLVFPKNLCSLYVSAVHCAEWGIKPHILLRGEQLDVPTGYNLISMMFGNVTYASRSLYAQRDEMLYEHAIKVAGCSGTVMWADEVIGMDLGVYEDTTDGNGSRRVMIVKEGAGSVQALLGKKGFFLASFHLSFMITHDVYTANKLN